MGGFKIFSIELTRGYGSNEFREDLKKLYNTAGIVGEPVVFLFSDTQVCYACAVCVCCSMLVIAVRILAVFLFSDTQVRACWYIMAG